MGISTAETKPELSKYELLEQIGHGGMATVYRARDRRLGRDVAVKVIHPHLRGSAEVAARFVSEARAVAMLKHENIVEVYDISEETDAERYLVVELVSGPTLRTLLSEHGALPTEVAAAIALQIAAALRHAHEQSIIHRDVKPENVLIAPPRTGGAGREERRRTLVKLTDFGIAKLLDAHGITSTGQVLGSPAHMAPEQIEGGDVGPRADVFGLGVLFYECMVGHLPFDGKNPAQVLRRVLEGDHPPADRERPQVGQQWSRIADKALMKDQEGRFESVEAFEVAIREELARLQIDDPDEELDRYMADPDGYLAAYTDRIVERLVGAGESARRAGDVIVATAEFNRALALRPGDRELVQRVSALARRSQLKRAAKIGGAVLVGFAAIGATAFGLSRKSSSEIDDPAEDGAVPRARIAPELPKRTTMLPSPTSIPSQKHAEAPRNEHETHAIARQPRVPRIEPAPADRDVRVKVVGPKGGVVVIDNEPLPNWLSGALKKVSVGDTHTFEFRFTNPDCCEAQAQKVVVAAGDGPLDIVINTSYKEAILQVVGPTGSLSCPNLFHPAISVPGSTTVRMSQYETRDKCLYNPEDPNSHPNVPVEVTLSPGVTTSLSVP